jgi:hypothetical protein
LLGGTPVKQPLTAANKRMLVSVGVGASTLVLVVIYVISFRYQIARVRATPDNLPRWGQLQQVFSGAMAPQAAAIANMKAKIQAAVSAQAVQAESIAIMKQKIESATATHQK